MNRRRLIVWSVVFAVALIAHALLTRYLAARDPIAEVLLGRAGSVLPLAVLTLLLRFAIIVVLPAFVVTALVALGLDRAAVVRSKR